MDASGVDAPPWKPPLPPEYTGDDFSFLFIDKVPSFDLGSSAWKAHLEAAKKAAYVHWTTTGESARYIQLMMPVTGKGSVQSLHSTFQVRDSCLFSPHPPPTEMSEQPRRSHE